MHVVLTERVHIHETLTTSAHRSFLLRPPVRPRIIVRFTAPPGVLTAVSRCPDEDLSPRPALAHLGPARGHTLGLANVRRSRPRGTRARPARRLDARALRAVHRHARRGR